MSGIFEKTAKKTLGGRVLWHLEDENVVVVFWADDQYPSDAHLNGLQTIPIPIRSSPRSFEVLHRL